MGIAPGTPSGARYVTCRGKLRVSTASTSALLDHRGAGLPVERPPPTAAPRITHSPGVTISSLLPGVGFPPAHGKRAERVSLPLIQDVSGQ